MCCIDSGARHIESFGDRLTARERMTQSTVHGLRRLTFDMSGPPPAWPAQRNINLRSGVGQAGGGPLDGRVRLRGLS
jgi:hypothetical protein